MDSMEIRG